MFHPSMVFVRLALLAIVASFVVLAGCAARQRTHPRYTEVKATTVGQLPPPSPWVIKTEPLPPSTARAQANVSDTNLTSVAPAPSVTWDTAATQLPPQAQVALPPRTPTVDRALATTAPTPIPETNTADAFSADASLYQNDVRPNVLTTSRGVLLYAPNSPVEEEWGTAAATAAAVRAAATTGARAFGGKQNSSGTQPSAEAFSVSYDERGIVMTLQGLFAPHEATLASGAGRRLDQAVRFLRKYPGRAVIVESHTDSDWIAPDNLQLSRNRAQMVRAALLARGIVPGRVSARGYGEAYPRASNSSAHGRAENRRMEIVVLPPGQAGPRYRELFEASAGELLENPVGEPPGTNPLDLGSDMAD